MPDADEGASRDVRCEAFGESPKSGSPALTAAGVAVAEQRAALEARPPELRGNMMTIQQAKAAGDVARLPQDGRVVRTDGDLASGKASEN